MDDFRELPLSKNTKIIFNLLQVKIFDLSQALQVASHKLTINQLKQNLEKQHNLFGQMQKVFDQLNLQKLYEIIKQVSQNYICIASILIDDKMTTLNAKYRNISSQNDQHNEKNSSDKKQIEDSKDKGSRRKSKSKTTIKKGKKQQEITEDVLKQCIDTVINQSSLNHQKLGGIRLLNENYVRGIQSLQNKWEVIEANKKKHLNQKQLIKELIFKEMNDKADVEKIHDNDEISKFIKQGKVKHELYNHIEYEKDLENISVFLKQSQDDAIKFLTETKKVSSNAQKQDDIIIGYHELIEILAQKKRNEFIMIENKIKQIVGTFKTKVQDLENQNQIKEAEIKELKYKLKRRQGKQISTQTVGLRNNLSLSSTSSLEDIEEQHKAIVQMLRKNIDTNQQQLLNLETDVRVKDQKIKKKDAEISALETEIQKIKKNLKEEKEKTLQIIRQKALPQNPNKQTGKPQNSQKVDEESLQDNENEDEEGFSRTNIRRKNKMVSGNYSTSMISNSGKYRKGREDSVLYSSGFAQSSQQYRRVNSMNSFNSSSSILPHVLNQIGQQYHSNQFSQLQAVKNQQIRPNYNQDISIERQQGKKISTNFSSQAAKLTQQNQGTNHDTQTQFQLTNTLNLPQSERQYNFNNIQEYTSSESAEQRIKSVNNYPNNSSDTLKPQNTRKPLKLTKKPTQHKNTDHYFDNTLSNPRDSDFIFSQQGILNKNAQALYDALFASVGSVDGKPFIIEEEIKKLKQFMSRYNQRQVQTRVKRMISFLNLNQHTERIVQKQIFEQDDTVSNSSKQLQKQNDHNKKSLDRYQQQTIVCTKSNNKTGVRTRQGRMEAEKCEKDTKPIDLESLKQRKIKKLLPSSKFLNQLHTQIRVSGKGFNLSKQEFIDLCKSIPFDERNIVSEHSSISDSEDQSKAQSGHKPFISNKYKNKEAVIIQNGLKQEQFNYNKSRLLNIQGQSIYEKSKEKGQTQNYKSKVNQELQNHEHQSNVSKSHKFSITKEIQHQIRSLIPVLSSNQSTQLVLDKKKQLKELYATLKNQGAIVDSFQKFQEMMELNQISLEDILKITNSLKSSKIQDVMSLFSHQCHNSKNKNHHKSFQIEPCCLHARRYETFLGKLSITENSVRKMRKDLLDIHIFNIDGNQSQKDIEIKKPSKSKSPKMIDISNLLSSRQVIQQKTKQVESFYVIKKNRDKTKQKFKGQKELTKKAAVSAYIQAKQKTETQIRRQNERKSVGNIHLKSGMTGFLPQLATKGMSQLIRD